MSQEAPVYPFLVCVLIGWLALWACMLKQNASKLTLKKIFVIVTGCAVLTALAAPNGQRFLRMTEPEVRFMMLAGLVIAGSVSVLSMTRKGS